MSFIGKWGPRPFQPRSAAHEYKLSLNDWFLVRRLVDRVIEARASGKFRMEAESELNKTWKEIGDKMGFVWSSVRQHPSKSSRWVIAFPKGFISGGGFKT